MIMLSKDNQCIVWSAMSIIRSIAAAVICMKFETHIQVLVTFFMCAARFIRDIPSLTHLHRCVWTIFNLGLRYEPGRSVTACDVVMITDPSNILTVLTVMGLNAKSCRRKFWYTIRVNLLILIILSLVFIVGYEIRKL